MTKAFTIVELLVVVAIIASLAALLLPVFASAKSEAKSKSCLSNLRQDYLAINLYQNDADDVFPAGKDCIDFLAPQTWSQSLQPKLAAMPLLSVVLRDYAKSNEVFRCPSDRGADVIDGQFPVAINAKPTAFSRCGISYEYHTELGLAGVTTTRIQNLSTVNLLSDIAGHWHGASSGLRSTDSRERYEEALKHYRYNMLYVDGHVKNVNFEEQSDAWKRG